MKIIEYKKIDYNLYKNLINKSGYYKTISYVISEDIDCILYRKDDVKHRLDGPAIIWPDGYEEYWIDGECISYNEQDFYNSIKYKQWVLLENMKLIKNC